MGVRAVLPKVRTEKSVNPQIMARQRSLLSVSGQQQRDQADQRQREVSGYSDLAKVDERGELWQESSASV